MYFISYFPATLKMWAFLDKYFSFPPETGNILFSEGERGPKSILLFSIINKTESTNQCTSETDLALSNVHVCIVAYVMQLIKFNITAQNTS